MSAETEPGPSTNERYIPTIAVASLDLLAVGSLVAKSDRCESAMKALSAFVKNAATKRMYTDPQMAGTYIQTHAQEVYCGDSVYLFGDQQEQLASQVLHLSLRVASLIATGLWIPNKFLVRAGISVGDLRIKVVVGEGIRHEIRIGASMIRSHRLQENQEWVGGALDAVAPVDEETRRWTAPFPVPLKSSYRAPGVPIALNWIGAAHRRNLIEGSLRQAVEEGGMSDHAMTKISNTLDFIQEVYETQTYAPLELRPL
jgi:hypothetical protein